jgi:YbbR domain-containing protein
MMKWIDNLFSSRAFLKVFSLVLAFFLWFYVTGDSNTDVVRSYRLALQLRNVPSGVTIQLPSREVEVQVAANRFLASNIIPEKDIVCYVDLQGLEPGRHTLPVKISLSTGLQLITVNPSTVDLRLEKSAERAIPVTPELPQLPDGYALRSVIVSPSQVIVRGTESDVKRITGAVVVPSLADLLANEKISLKVMLEPQSQEWSSVTVIPDRVDFQAEVDIVKIKKEVPIFVPIEGEPHPDYIVTSILTTPGNVILEGSKVTLNGISSITTKSLNISGIKEDMEAQLPISVPKGINVLGDKSVTVKVTLKQRIATMKYENLEIEIRGRGIYRNWKIDPTKVDVIIEGPPSIVSSLEGKEPAIVAYVDITNIVSRRLSIPVNVEVKVKGISVEKVDPDRVTFTVLD